MSESDRREGTAALRPETEAPDRRRTGGATDGGDSGDASPFDALAPFMRGFRLDDILSTAEHSEDFVETRAEYIQLRLRFMVVFYALAVPLWAPFDFLLLAPAQFKAMLVARLSLAALLVPLALFTLRKLDSRQVHLALALAILAPALFHATATTILASGPPVPPLAGYAMLPYLMVAMLGVFPLTLAWGAALIALVAAVDLALAAWQGQLMSAGAANSLWAFLLFGGITLWVQSGQLMMLLKLYRESTQDPLTGLVNRRVMMKRLASEIARANARAGSFCVLMFDLDRFKRINDSHGHLTGDKVLKTTADLLTDCLRRQDALARFGGEEFVAVLHDTPRAEAIAVAERIRARCHQTFVAAPNGDAIQLSTSVGVTEYEAGEAIEVTLRRVDDSLYKAKELGRNRVVHSQSSGMSVPDPSAG